jgi:phospholipid/cholesterol/gamma-HCH transport system substrate-binding protein
MSSNQTKIRVGMFAIAVVTLAVVVIVTFTSLHLFRHRDQFSVLFTGSVYGLEEGSLVYFDGIKAGSVDHIEVAPEDLTKVRVTILVDPKTPVRADTTAELTMAGITGLKIVDLRGGSPTTPRLTDGATITAKQGTFDKLQSAADKLADQTTTLMDKVGKLVDRSTTVATNVETASASLRDMIAENKDSLHHAIGTFDTTVADAGEQVRKLGASANQLIDNTNKIITGAHGFVDGANTVVGDVGRIIHENSTQLSATMSDLRQASRTFKEIARELRDKPSRIIFSGDAPDRKMP